jgi:hypothetical protein
MERTLPQTTSPQLVGALRWEKAEEKSRGSGETRMNGREDSEGGGWETVFNIIIVRVFLFSSKCE